MNIRKRLKYKYIGWKAKRFNKFRIKCLGALRSIIGGYLACAYEGHHIKLNTKWSDDMYEFSCKGCALFYLKRKKDLTDSEKILIAISEKTN